MTLDINRLHDVYFGIRTGRLSGRTTLWATYLVGISQMQEYSEKTIQIWVQYWNTVKLNYLPCIEEVANAMEVPFTQTSDIGFTLGCTKFVFCNLNDKVVSPLFELAIMEDAI